jgi:hypothetical protein
MKQERVVSWLPIDNNKILYQQTVEVENNELFVV